MHLRCACGHQPSEPFTLGYRMSAERLEGIWMNGHLNNSPNIIVAEAATWAAWGDGQERLEADIALRVSETLICAASA